PQRAAPGEVDHVLGRTELLALDREALRLVRLAAQVQRLAEVDQRRRAEALHAERLESLERVSIRSDGFVEPSGVAVDLGAALNADRDTEPGAELAVEGLRLLDEFERSVEAAVALRDVRLGPEDGDARAHGVVRTQQGAPLP